MILDKLVYIFPLRIAAVENNMLFWSGGNHYMLFVGLKSRYA